MKPRTLIISGIIEVALLLTGVYFEPTYSVRGRLHGEAFFEGKSTSWWRQELDRWDVRTRRVRRHGWCASEPPIYFRDFSRESTWFERQRQRWAPREFTDDDKAVEDARIVFGPQLLSHSNAQARDVLTALLDDESPKIRRFARIGLGIEAAGEGE
jgi:hypothetical protein